MAAFSACACKLSWTLLSPARVQSLYGVGGKESSGTGLTVTLPTELQGRTEKVGNDFGWYIDNEYASLLFSQDFFRIVSAYKASLQKFLKEKSDAYK